MSISSPPTHDERGLPTWERIPAGGGWLTNRACVQVLVRFGLLGFFALCGVAIVMGRSEPGLVTVRKISLDRPTPISLKTANHTGSGCQMLSSGAMTLEQLQLGNGQFLDHASVSPWRDESGKWQVVGCWTQWKGPIRDRVLVGSGLMRMSYPDGEILDQIATSTSPTSPPSWLPGTAAQVVFVGSNGLLHYYDFESDSKDKSDRVPHRISWNVPGLSESSVQIKDICWPNHPQFANRAIATLSHYNKREDRGGYYTPVQIWWLEFDLDGMTVTKAGRLTPHIPDSLGRSELSPSVHVSDSGEMLLAYLTKRDGDPTWRLHCTKLESHPRSGLPMARLTRGLALDSRIRPDAPVFSSDGTSVVCPLSNSLGKLVIARKPLHDFDLNGRKRIRRSLATATEFERPQS